VSSRSARSARPRERASRCPARMVWVDSESIATFAFVAEWGLQRPPYLKRETRMAESTNKRSNIFDIVLSNIAASVIVIVGVLAYAYVGERMTQGSGTMATTIEARG
jgi:hypothetical protein